MSKEKHGFVYLWYDTKKKMYYVGCHWGTEDDGYICSSQWMRDAYHNRPQDFKRRILSRIHTSREDMFDEEYRYLQMIKPEEIKTKYYNLFKVHKNHWSGDPKTYQSLSEKMKGNKNGVGPRPPETGKNISEAKKEAFKNKRYIRTVPYPKGWKHSPEWKEAASQRTKEQWENGIRNGKPQTEESNLKRSQTLKRRKPSQATLDASKAACSKTYRVYNQNTGEVFDIINLKQFARINSLSDSNMIKSSSKGYHAYLI